MRISLVQQGVWHMAKESMPLAAGYLAAVLRADPAVSERAEVEILNLPGSRAPIEMAIELLTGQMPDVIGFSVLGWNVRQFCAVAEALKQVHPQLLVVFGGNHVANQAERVFSQSSAVDVIVNGEGEISFPELVKAHLDGGDLAAVPGISFRGENGAVVTTEAAERLQDLDLIPSPILSGIIPLLDDEGEFRYDVALMETNRGCPYKCAFCYWGGAVGQRVRSFSRERLRAELEQLAQARAETIVLCDANFGMLAQDEEFVDDLIEIKRRYGYPRALETSWAKNKSKTFYSIVRKMKAEGLRTSFTLALQTLDEPTLLAMNRKNMKINAWKEMAEWLAGEGLDIYAELIWGAPGQTMQSFLDGYDELARYVSRIAAYPLLLLPNTDYTNQRELYGFVTIRGERDDFEYVLATKGVDVEQNIQMRRFLFWARMLAENLLLRNSWPVLRSVLGMEQSTSILSIADFVDRSDSPTAKQLRAAAAASTADPDSLAPVLEFCFTEQAFDELIMDWWKAELAPRTPAALRPAVEAVIRFDLDSRPLPDPARRHPDAQLGTFDGEKRWTVERDYAADVLDIVRVAQGDGPYEQAMGAAALRSCTLQLSFKDGFALLARSTNHEETAHYVALVAPVEDEITDLAS